MMRIALAAAAALLLQGESFAQSRASDRCGVAQAQEEWRANDALRKCAHRGDAEAQAWLGMLYWGASESEPYTPSDWGLPPLTASELQAEGRRLLALASAAGVAAAQNELGRAYLLGAYGAPIDHDAALELITAAALQDDEVAMFNLAHAHYRGWGVPQSTDEAIRWLRRSAELGYRESSCTLASVLEARGGADNVREAYALRASMWRTHGFACSAEDEVEGFP